MASVRTVNARKAGEVGMIMIDMDIPDNCDECRFNTEYGFCKAMPDNFCGNADDRKRPEWCPLKEQEAKELTIKEWQEWKKDKNHDPICLLWEYDCTPIWILDANHVHEPALLMGKCKLFKGKPSHEQCKEVKWDD